ncbi:hypothetical protein BKA00_007086 [Actinomadura coerulea]|uniref:Uncharacterized protein n=1 Tax=Actinomadura coerulea TaxID=46159 RepID=A0A7X0L345_9ACTN|nr:hypothetical protein [Actinomadura coerulea]MBB6400172.1 hypothetical protein [Actinomadura coerulea]GGQ22503.1 hypothetical protein GCM10010187_43750 [Actinomadura coerulea]
MSPPRRRPGDEARPKGKARPDDEARTRRIDPLAVALEASIILLLGFVLAGVSIGLLIVQAGDVVTFDAGDVVTAAAAGVVAAAVVRLTVRLHRRWKRTIGRFTAAAALCALAAGAGALAVLVPGECPGGLFSTGRCGVREAAAWGQVAGLAAVLNFMIAGMALTVWRLVRRLAREVRAVVRDGAEQGVIWFRALKNIRGRRAGAREAGGEARGAQDSKGRPTPRRADAERARRKRLRARA